jgi:hypothetical protein
MNRRNFLKTTSLAAGAYMINDNKVFSYRDLPSEETWFNRPMRWAQLTLVENDPGKFDPDFWLSYFRKIHADGATLSAGGIVAYYPTDIQFHHRSSWLGSSDPFGYFIDGCRKMNMSVIARTDPHAIRQDAAEAHPEWVAVTSSGEKRRHWANNDLWVTCALGPYNFDFMSGVHKEIMEKYRPDAIFANRWAGHGICYCENCRKNFREYSGLELPEKADKNNMVFQKYNEWNTVRLKELWLLWDGIVRETKPEARFIPNGFPDKVITGQLSDIVFTDHQARSGYNMPWVNGRVAKELRASIGMKPLGGIFSVGVEEQYRWKDSVQTEAETRVWVAEGTANGMRPWFTKFSGVLYDKRWLDIVDKIYQVHYRNEKYLRNVKPMARIGLVYSEKIDNYGKEKWQQNAGDHSSGMYHALIESRLPFEMVNDRLMDADHLNDLKLLILPNIAVLSTQQCDQIRNFIMQGGSILATFETSLYDEAGRRRNNFGLADLFGVSYDNGVEGPMQNSYLRLKEDPVNKKYHPVLKGLEDAYRVINTVNMVKVIPRASFPLPVTVIPTYPDLPMEDVYPRIPETENRGLYLRDTVKGGRIAYFPCDIDRTFWQIMNNDHGLLLKNTIMWALKEDPAVEVSGPGVLDVTMWKQANSITVHLVNLTNPMMIKGPFRELIPVNADIKISIPENEKISNVKLLVSAESPSVSIKGNNISLSIKKIFDHEIIGIDLV